MNKIIELFNNIPDEELKQAIREIEEDAPKGIYKTDGLLRKYAKIVTEITGNPVSTELFLTEINLYKQAALRWVKE